MIQRDLIDAIRERSDIAEVVGQAVSLKRKGSSLMGLCPFHQEKSPSFSVVPHKGIFHCFGCGEGGDVFKFIMKTRGLSFMEAVKELGDACGLAVEERELSPDEQRRVRSRRDLVDVCDLACGWFNQQLRVSPEGGVCRDYLAGRGFSLETQERFRLGFAPERWDGLLNYLHNQGVGPEMAVKAGLARQRDDNPRRGAYDLFRNRVIVPVLDLRGRVVAFGGRVLPGAPDDAPKYVNSPETELYRKSNVLFGLSAARPAIQRRDRVILVEGYFDVIALHQAGFDEAVATCGTALTSEHLEAIRRLSGTVIAQFDSDEAGQRAAVKSMELFAQAGIEARRLDLSPAKDPDEYLLKNGAPAFEDLLARSEPLFDLVVRRAVALRASTPGGAQRAVDDLASVLRRIPSGSAMRLAMVHRVAGALGLSEAVVEERVGAGAPAAPRGAPAQGTWRGDPLLNRLLWLLAHYPSQVSPLINEVEADVISDRPTVLQVIAMLMNGMELAQAIDRCEDADLARILRAAAAKTDLHAEEGAEVAGRQVLVRMQLARVDRLLGEADSAVAGCTSGADGSSMTDALRRRDELQKRKRDLNRAFSRMGR